jgi:ubiquinone/menaquinone biosynthesis C-methylase UbiE
VNTAADFYAWFTAQAAWRASCAQVASHLPDGSRLRVLDLGCGPGASTFELARARPNASIVGLDLTMHMLKQARRRLPRAGLGVRQLHWLWADAMRLPFQTASLDAVTTHSFLYFIPNRAAVLAECLRVLRSGGAFVAMEPSERPATLQQVWRVSRDVRFLISIGLWQPFSRVHGRFSARSLCTTLEQVGFAGCAAEETLGGLGVLAWAEKPR